MSPSSTFVLAVLRLNRPQADSNIPRAPLASVSAATMFPSAISGSPFKLLQYNAMAENMRFKLQKNIPGKYYWKHHIYIVSSFKNNIFSRLLNRKIAAYTIELFKQECNAIIILESIHLIRSSIQTPNASDFKMSISIVNLIPPVNLFAPIAILIHE